MMSLVRCLRTSAVAVRPRATIRPSWTQEEERELSIAFESGLLDTRDAIRQVASTTFPQRTLPEIRRRVAYLQRNRQRRVSWTQEEDEALLAAVDVFGTKWTKVSTVVPGRDPHHCLKRWRHLHMSSVVHISRGEGMERIHVVSSANLGRFTKEEQERLKEAVEAYGTHNWAAVSRKVETRTAKQCQDAWEYVHAETIATGPWSPEEDLALATAVEQEGRNWVRVAEFMRRWRQSEVNLKGESGALRCRTARQCRQRAQTIGIYGKDAENIGSFSQSMNTAGWMQEEDAILKKLIRMDGKELFRWVSVAAQLPGRSKAACRIRYAWLKQQHLGQHGNRDVEKDENESGLEDELFAAMGNDVARRNVLNRELEQLALDWHSERGTMKEELSVDESTEFISRAISQKHQVAARRLIE